MKMLDWAAMGAGERAAALARPAPAAQATLGSDVARILAQVRADGDGALRALTRRFDGVELDRLEVEAEEFASLDSRIGLELQQAVRDAFARIVSFHREGMQGDYSLETAKGITCARVIRPIGRVGLYVPAGSAPLPSTALMLGVPSWLAANPQRIACTPPARNGQVDPLTLFAMKVCGISRVFRLGGAQAIAAMAFGSASVPRCDKLFGPGNAWVTEAKRQVSAMRDGAAIDMPAGPSEVMVIADESAEPAWVAADLLAQCEHGPDSQAMLVSDSDSLLRGVLHALSAQLRELPRRAIACASLEHARALRVRDIGEAVDIANSYAPEHLLVQVRDPHPWLPAITTAGSVFLGRFTPESLGDYASGTNHVLPTDGCARSSSGLCVSDFQRRMTVQHASAAGLAALAPCVVSLARAEGLEAHARAIEIRSSSASLRQAHGVRP